MHKGAYPALGQSQAKKFFFCIVSLKQHIFTNTEWKKEIKPIQKNRGTLGYGAYLLTLFIRFSSFAPPVSVKEEMRKPKRSRIDWPNSEENLFWAYWRVLILRTLWLVRPRMSNRAEILSQIMIIRSFDIRFEKDLTRDLLILVYSIFYQIIGWHRLLEMEHGKAPFGLNFTPMQILLPKSMKILPRSTIHNWGKKFSSSQLGI